MIKIGITGSIASGKTTASRILSANRGPLFSADLVVKKLYSNKKFKNLVVKKFNLTSHDDLKKKIKAKILENKKNIEKLESLVHPIVRKEMKKFISLNKKKSIIFLEIPLLIESKLNNFFDRIIFIKANKKIRSRRFRLKGGDIKFFNLLDKRQLGVTRKVKFCDHVIVNEMKKSILKKKLLDIVRLYA